MQCHGGIKCTGGSGGGTGLLSLFSIAQSLDRSQSVLGCKVSVPAGHLDGLVPHQLLYSAQVNAGHYVADLREGKLPQLLPIALTAT